MLEQNFYDILEVTDGATVQEVERAYRIARSTYQPASIATYSLFSDDENTDLLRRIEEAYAVLSDPRMRREYDARLRREGGHGHAAPPPVASAPLASSPEPRPAERRQPDYSIDEPEVPSDGLYDGQVLRQIRIRRGIELDEISSQTKITELNLGFIEANRYADLPADVYLRGFLRQYAQCLNLDPLSVADGYMSLADSDERRAERA